MNRLIAAAMALSCALIAGPALANDEVVQVQGRVSYAGLDLNNPSDIQTFDRRVAREARQICRRGIADPARYSGVINDCRASVMMSGKLQLSLASASRGQAGIASGH